MALSETLRNVKTIHAYVAVVGLGVAFSVIGFIDQLQLAIVTLFFGFIALGDEIADLSRSIDSVNSQLTRVTGQLDRVNDDDQSRGQDSDQERNP